MRFGRSSHGVHVLCGIAGIFDTQGYRRPNREVLERMNTSLSHRGPDGQGYHLEPGVGFGHRRLSIIDLEGGKQPLFNEDGSVVVTYNGEIYNFQSLRAELIQAGHQFRTNCDTEVIVHGWEQWGEDCVTRFNGMFAFAVWDRHKNTLFLARDRLGIKPLFYGMSPEGELVFGSELKALLEYDSLPRNISLQAIEEYFAFGYIPEPGTILKDVYKLPPGTTLKVEKQKVLPQPKSYWNLEFEVLDHEPSELSDTLITKLNGAVQRRLIADVPLGAFLSGGVDSSAVVAMMAGLSQDPVNTCSISFGDPKFNESQFAASVAQQFETNHKVEQVDADDYELLDKLVDLYDEPYADSSAIPTYRVCELARKNVTVALSGDGGDENFAGYRRYRWHAYEEKVRRLVPSWLRRPVFGTLGAIYPKLDWAPRFLRAKSTLQALGRSSLEGYLHSVSIFPLELRRQLFTRDLLDSLDGYTAMEVFRRHAEHFHSNDSLSLVQYLDFKTYLPGDILTKVDRASMAHGLEVRVPLLDHTFVEWVASIDSSKKLSNGEGKFAMKKALEQHLSDDILYREKMGFAVPLAKWFRGPLKQRVRDTLLRGTLSGTGFFDDGQLRTIVNRHETGQRDHSAIIWALLMFEGSFKRIFHQGH